MEGIADILRRLQRELPTFSKRVEEARKLEGWEKAVGPAIARHAKVRAVREGRLFVEVDHPAWQSELHYRKRQILEKLNAGGECFEDIVFVGVG